MKKRLAVMLATWFYCGLLPPKVNMFGRMVLRSGTYGCLGAILLCYPAILAGRISVWWYGLITAIIFLIGLWSVPIAEVKLGALLDYHKKIKKKDQNQIVIDEVMGMLITCFPLIWPWPLSLYWGLIISLVLFRIFDLVKPWPAKYFNKKKNAWGVMMDDAVAGLYAALVLTAILWVAK